MIPYGHQHIDNADIEEVIKVLKSDFLTQGPIVPEFEEKIAEYTGAKYAVASNSATSSLHLACLALGVTAGDIVWISSISFVASANCAIYCRAQIDFVDIDPNNLNISIQSLKIKLNQAEKNKKLPKVIIVVHMCGQPCDMEEIHTLRLKYNFKIIEDASHAIGAKYKTNRIGSCEFSDITIFSFHPVKIITTGEGGMGLTNNLEYAKLMLLQRTHGITRDEKTMLNQSHGPWFYEQILLGYNYRMTDIQAALGLSQIKKIDLFVSRRHQIAERYDDKLKNLPLQLPFRNSFTYSSFHLYVIRLKLDLIKKSRLDIFNALRNEGIGVNIHYLPIYLHPYFKEIGFQENYCIEAEKYYAEAITLPIFYDLTEVQQDKIIQVLKSEINF